MNYFGERIFELRRKKGLTQDALAEALNVTAQAVSKWERGESMPDVALLPKLAELFDTTIDSLFGREKNPIVEYVPEKKRDFESAILKITVNDDSDKSKINVNLPLLLVKTLLELGLSSKENSIEFNGVDLSSIDFKSIVKLVENGAIGRLVEVESDDCRIVVEVI